MKSILRYFQQSRIPAILATWIVFVACTYPSKHLPEITSDKTEHLIAFFGLGGLWAFCQKSSFKTLIILVFFGILIEVWQGLLPQWFHRGFDWLDSLADAVGAVFGVAVSEVLKKSLDKYLQV